MAGFFVALKRLRWNLNHHPPRYVDNLIPFLISVGVSYSTAVLAIALTVTRCRSIAWVMIAPVLCGPLIIPSGAPLVRAAALFLALDCSFRLIELMRLPGDSRKNGQPGLKDRLIFLTPLPIMTVLFEQKRRQRRPGNAKAADAASLALGCAGFAVCWGILDSLRNNPLLKESHLIDHTFKLVLFVAAVESGGRALCALERFAGYRSIPIIRLAFLARTPAEFWRRWNNRIHAWLYRHVFLPAGGAALPALGVWAACLFSGLFHELMFGIATSRFDGYQALFFTLQAPAVLLSGQLEMFARKGGRSRKAAAHAITFAWLWATSFLFFHGIDRVIPVYYTSEPWLP